MEEERPPSSSFPLWMGFGVWVAMLAALLRTSQYAATTFTTGGYLWQLWSQMIPSGYTSGYTAASEQALSPTTVAVMIVVSAMMLAVVVLIGSAWLKFVTLSHHLIVSYAWLEQEDEESTMFFDLLNFPATGEEGAEEEVDLDLDKAEGTLVGDIVRYLAYCWAVLLLMPPVIVAVGAWL
jgi:hypothetical protein